MANDWYGREKCIPMDPAMRVLHLPHGLSRTNWRGRVSPRLDDDTWWVHDRRLLWRIGYRSGVQFAGLWELCRSITLPPGSVIIEIGTMLGDSAAVFAAAFPGVRIITVDPGPTAAVQREAAERLWHWPHVECWEMASAAAAVRVRADGLRVGMVYLDGDHSEAGVRADIRAWLPLVMPGGYMAGHDYAVKAYPGVKSAVDAELGVPGQVFPDGSWLAARAVDDSSLHFPCPEVE
jgi:hypothetical protein